MYREKNQKTVQLSGMREWGTSPEPQKVTVKLKRKDEIKDFSKDENLETECRGMEGKEIRSDFPPRVLE